MNERALVAKAIQKVLGALSVDYGVDCAGYAVVGAVVLKRLGYESAQAVAGETVWRVGPADGDVISHAPSVMHSGMGVYGRADAPAKSRMFHAWVELDGELVDFSMFCMRDKAAALDAADGGKTDVQWAPDYLWVEKSKCLALPDVAQSFKVGVYGYKRDPLIEQDVLTWSDEEQSPDDVADSVMQIYGLLKSGAHVTTFASDGAGGWGSVEDRARESLGQGLVNKTVPAATKGGA